MIAVSLKMWDTKAEDLCLGDPHAVPPCHNPASSGQLSPLFLVRIANHARTFLSARLSAVRMADDHEGQQFVATPNDFRDLARGVGVALNDAIHKGRVRVIEHRGFNTVKIEREEDTSDTAMKDLIHVMEEYKCKVSGL